MAMYVSNEAELDVLAAVRTYANTNWRIGLYTNVTPAMDDDTEFVDIADADDTYTPGSEQTPVYGAPATVAGTATMTAAALTWTWASGGGETIAGYYIRNNATGKLVKIQSFGAGIVMGTAGDQIVITDKFLLKGSITS